MKYYVVKVKGNHIKSFRLNSFGNLTIYYAKHGERIFSTTDQSFATDVASLLNGEAEEVTE